jgi:hypothetical protein
LPNLQNALRSLVLPFHPMRKFEEDVVYGMAMPERARVEALRSLVKFAIAQGYYEPWNMPSEPCVRPYASREFPTDRGSVSR